ncbi:helix-turn-helix domain-containing protein [Myxococcus eversor]|uniref:helix-turn-helix domain-containing protein n=1 Tax=Myxococcus eversor TaxID=2709661 RepID=UPI0013CFDF0F|nr:ImmA/IrrE family metallo-endopeptidase [Myxococcus eversor]
MPLDLAEISRKLLNIRQDILQLSLDEVAKRANIDIADLRKMEAGLLEPTGDQILILSDIYNEPFQYFITHQKSATVETTTELYRMHGDQFKPSDRAQIQEFLLLCRYEQDLETMMDGRPRVQEYKPTPDEKYKKGHGHKNARNLRNKLKIANAPIDNVFHLVRSLGCHIFRRKLGNSSISGIFIRHPTIGRCILLNYDEDIYRQKFSALHELGHAILDTDYKTNLTFKTDLTSSHKGPLHDSHNLREVRANAFAGRLLVPVEAIQDINIGATIPEKATTTLKICLHYKVNYDVGLIALKEAGKISESDHQALRGTYKIGKEAKIDPEIENEPTQIQQRRHYILDRGLSPDYVKTCFEAYHRRLISIGKLSETLRARIDELMPIATAYGEQLWSDQ